MVSVQPATCKIYKAGMVICIGLMMFLLFFAQTVCDSYEAPVKSYDISMITWRSQTLAEQGFKDYFEKSFYNINYHMYNAEQDIVRLDRIIDAIKMEKSDLVYVFGTTATKVVLSRITDIPVLFNVVTRPVEAGIIDSWEHSGNNSTGVSSMVPIENQLKALKKVVDYKVLAMVYNPLEPNSLIQRDVINRLTGQLNFRLMELPVNDAHDIEKMVAGINGCVDALYLPSDSRIISLGKEIMHAVNRLKIPSLSAVESMVVNDDALMGLVPDYYDLGKLAASKAIQIFNGKKPSEIPCSTLEFFHISINMKTARKIGAQIPTSLLIISDTIIR